MMKKQQETSSTYTFQTPLLHTTTSQTEQQHLGNGQAQKQPSFFFPPDQHYLMTIVRITATVCLNQPQLHLVTELEL